MDRFLQALGLRKRPRPRVRYALALAGGGVIGGMYEVGTLAAIEERIGEAGFDVYVGCSAGSVVASLLANGMTASELYKILDQDLPDPLNFRRSAVYPSDAFRHAAANFGRFMWAVGKNAMTGFRSSVPDMLARAGRDMPAGFFSITALERYMREAYRERGLRNAFAALPHTLLIPAVDLDRAERVVFGRGALAGVPITAAIAASSAIPGFFEPYTIDGRDYVDGGVGFTGHADLAAEEGADVVIVVNPLVPTLQEAMRARGVYTIMEQANRIYSQNLLQLGLSVLATKYPRTEFFLIQPPPTCQLLFGPSMGFEASRQALRYGYESTRSWLDAEGAPLVRRLQTPHVTPPVEAVPRVITANSLPEAEILVNGNGTANGHALANGNGNGHAHVNGVAASAEALAGVAAPGAFRHAWNAIRDQVTFARRASAPRPS